LIFYTSIGYGNVKNITKARGRQSAKREKGKKTMSGFLRAVVLDEGGATAVEYGLIAALISIAGVAAFTSMGSSLAKIYTFISDQAKSASS
jgi:pilus assembly protein Flp/PilA